MITISVLGLDQFVVGNYSKAHTSNIANLFECLDEDVNFYAPQSMIFHNGVEQTSWHTEIIVRAPSRFMMFEGKVAEYLMSTLSSFTINIEISFNYFEEEHHYERLNEQYPRYIESDNVMEVSDDYEEEYEDDEPDPRDRADLDYDNEHELYLGDAFAGHEEELEAKHECECGDGECSCGHHHHKK